MNKNMKKATLVFAIFLVFIIGITLATYTWHMTITWQPTPDETISVWQDELCSDPWIPPLEFYDVTLGEQPPIDFYIKNEGDVAVDVTILEETLIGATVSWVPTSLSGLAIGDSALMTLTLTFDAESGSYVFDFESNKAA